MEKLMKALLLTVFLMVGSASAGLVENGDFETGDLSGWFSGGSAAISIAADNGPSEAGVSCVQISTSGNKDLRSQGIPVVVGNPCALVFDYKTSANATGNPQVRFRFWDGLGEGGTYGSFKGEAQRNLDLTNGEWVTIDPMEMIAPEGAIAVDIVFTVNVFGSFEGDFMIDNVNATVPEPASMLLISVGGLVISRFRK